MGDLIGHIDLSQATFGRTGTDTKKEGALVALTFVTDYASFEHESYANNKNAKNRILRRILLPTNRPREKTASAF